MLNSTLFDRLNALQTKLQSESNKIQTQKHLVCTQTLNHWPVWLNG